MRKENGTIEITEEVKIGNGVILEKGDRIQIINESSYSNEFEGTKIALDGIDRTLASQTYYDIAFLVKDYYKGYNLDVESIDIKIR